MTIIEVKTPLKLKHFHQIPFIFIKMIPIGYHIKQDVEKVFTPSDNKFFRHGEAVRWILKDNNGFNRSHSSFHQQKKKHLLRNNQLVESVFLNV